MKFTFEYASRYFDQEKEEIEINSLEDLERLETQLRENETRETLIGFPCCLIVDFSRREITYYDSYIE